MKWIGQHIFDLISRFRNDVYVDKKLHDSSGSAGATGKILTTDGSILSWTDYLTAHLSILVACLAMRYQLRKAYTCVRHIVQNMTYLLNMH